MEAVTSSSHLVASFRRRIAIWFAVLSSLVYLSLTLGGTIFFYASMNYSLDGQLVVLASELGHAIDLRSSKPFFRDWARIVQTEPARSLGPIQLFDANGNLLEAYGPKDLNRLYGANQREAAGHESRWRIRSTPLTHDGHLVGYLQIGLPVRDRDEAIHQLMLMIAIFAPLIVVGLGLSSYYVSGKASLPVEANIRFLRRFIADASHELNTPLSIAQARLDSVRKKFEKQNIIAGEKDLSILNSSLLRMTKIVSDLMLLAQVEAHTTARRITHIDLKEMSRGLESEFSELCQDKELLMRFDCRATCVMADESMLFRLLRNLIENSIKHTNPGGNIDVTFSNAENNFGIVVKDSGIGISEEKLPHVFERFYRVDDSRSRESGGIGLGLSIVKAIVEAHDGSINISSKVGQGTCVTVEIPSNHSCSEFA